MKSVNVVSSTTPFPEEHNYCTDSTLLFKDDVLCIEGFYRARKSCVHVEIDYLKRNFNCVYLANFAIESETAKICAR